MKRGRREADRLVEFATGNAPAGADGAPVTGFRDWRTRDGRRVWATPRRLHVQLRQLPGSSRAAIVRELEDRVGAIAGVDWARVHEPLGRLVVAHDRGRVAPDDVLAAIGDVEARRELARRPFQDGWLPYPGDGRPIARVLVEMAADAASLGLAQAVRVVRKDSVRPVEIDLVAALSIFEAVPALRRPIERAVGPGAVEIGIEFATAALQSVMHSDLGPPGRLIRHGLELRALRARRATWAAREPELCGGDGAEPGFHPPLEPRPRALPDGPVEKYVDRAVPASLSAFALAAASVRHLDEASAPLFAGLPRPAKLGRSAFAHHLEVVLARRGVLVHDPHVLERLDRLDCAVLDAGALEAGRRAEARALIDEVRDAELELVVAGDPGAAAWTGADRFVARGSELPASIRTLQAEGRGVLFVGGRAPLAHRASDCGVGIWDGGGPPPWGAHLICRDGLSDAAVIASATVSAKVTSKQSVTLSVVDAGAGVALAFGGLKMRTTKRVLQVANLASIVSMANGVRRARASARRHPPPRGDGPQGGPGPGSDGRGDTATDEPPWHALSAEDALEAVGSRAGGLSAREAAKRRQPPAPPPSRAATFARMVGDELAGPFAPVLAAGAGLSALAGSITDATMIASVVGINGLVGGAQRYRTERDLAHLRRRAPRRAHVRREAGAEGIDATELVPGDVVEIESSEPVPADCRLLEADALEVDESALTGESQPVRKTADPVAEDTAVADRASMIFDGTNIAAGRAVAAVVRVGDDTEMRRAARTDERPPPRGVEARLESLGRVTVPAAVGAGLTSALSGWARGVPASELVQTGVGLSVAAVPEGLPILATMSQLAAARRLSDRGVLVRNPRAIEALGRVDVLCADKTGTLTEGAIELACVVAGDREAAVGELDDRHRRVVAAALGACPRQDGRGAAAHATDRALADAAHRLGATGHRERPLELPFEPSRGFHAALLRDDDRYTVAAKGAPEVVVPRCARTGDRGEAPLADLERRRIDDRANRLAARGLRVLAVAERTLAAEEELPAAQELSDDDVSDLTFLGLIAFADPVRPSARDAVDRMRRAGVRTVMVTGDHPQTAERIAVEVGLSNGLAPLSGTDIDALSDDDLERALARASVIARASPSQKLRIVRALQHAGHAVAMTGDGANDGPAIHLADVGIAVGAEGTAAAREVADLVVTEGRIETLAAAVLEGRSLWPAVRDAVSILVGGNLGEIAFSLLGGALEGRSSLGARQLLLVNLITDTLPSLALALRAPRQSSAEDLLREGPSASLGHPLTRDLAWRAAITTAGATGAWVSGRALGLGPRASTAALLALTGTQLGQTLLSGRGDPAVLATGVGTAAALLAIVEIPPLSRLFGCRPLGPVGLLVAGANTALATGAAALVPAAVKLREHASRARGIAVPAPETPEAGEPAA